MTDAVVRVAPGNGFIARHGDALLFVPSPSPAHEALLRSFREAPVQGASEAVTRHVDVQASSADPAVSAPFALAEWSAGLRVVVNGDVEVTSDRPALPRLSAAGAGTWVERSIRDVEGPITIAVGAADIDAATDFREGLVHAGGFELTYRPASPDPTPDVAVAHQPASPSPADASGGRIAAAPDDVTIVPDDAMRDEIAQIVRAEAGDADDPDPPPPPSPPRWRLAFTDGMVVDVDRTLVLGRKPVLRDGEDERTTRLVTVDCPQVSSRHLAVRTDGHEISIVDLGSSNGSFVLTTGDGRLVQLEPGVPHQLSEGTIVQIGTKRFQPEAIG